MLADQGAEAIKIEPPSNDLMRHFRNGRNGMSAFFLSCNRNKRSLAVDRKAAEGLAIIRKLIATADVLVHNFRPGAAERIGLGEDAVHRIRDDLVYVSIRGFGDRGPYANQRAYDPVIQALSGLGEIQTDRDTGRPKMVRTIIADKTTVLTAAQAITAALFARERSGQGQHVWIAMLDAMIAYLWPEAMPNLTFVGEERDPSEGESGPQSKKAPPSGSRASSGDSPGSAGSVEPRPSAARVKADYQERVGAAGVPSAGAQPARV